MDFRKTQNSQRLFQTERKILKRLWSARALWILKISAERFSIFLKIFLRFIRLTKCRIKFTKIVPTVRYDTIRSMTCVCISCVIQLYGDKWARRWAAFVWQSKFSLLDRQLSASSTHTHTWSDCWGIFICLLWFTYLLHFPQTHSQHTLMPSTFKLRVLSLPKLWKHETQIVYTDATHDNRIHCDDWYISPANWP